MQNDCSENKIILTSDEIVILKNALLCEYRYIARNYNGDLNFFQRKPGIVNLDWYNGCKIAKCIFTNMFDFVTYEKCLRISELLESNGVHVKEPL